MPRSHPPHPPRKQAELAVTVVSVPAPARLTEKEQVFHDGLTEHLLFALPVAMLEVSSMPPHALDSLRAKAAAAIGGRGDVLQSRARSTPPRRASSWTSVSPTWR